MALISQLLKPPVFGDEDRDRTARQLHVILLATAALLLLLEIIFLVNGQSLLQTRTSVLALLILTIAGLFVLLRRGYVHTASGAFLTITWAGLFYLSWHADGIFDVVFAANFVVILMAALLGGWRVALSFGALSILAGWGLALAQTSGIIDPTLDSPTSYARDITVVLILAGLTLYFLVGSLQNALRQARQTNQELQQLSASLETRIAERTRDLALAADVSQSVAQIQDRDQLLETAVNLIRDRFQLYHVQIYLLEHDRLALRAATGDAGRRLRAQGHFLPVDNLSINGRVALRQQSILVPDTAADRQFRPNPLLPRTRAELSVPLLVGQQLYGVLDLQSSQPNGLTAENVAPFESLAGQLAVAVANAALFAENQQARDELAWFKLGIERSVSAVFLTDLDGVIRYANPAFETVYGYSPAEAVGQNPRIIKSGLIPPDQYVDFWTKLLNRQVVAGEIPNRAKNGRIVTVAASNNPVIDENGRLIGFLAVHTDVTARKESETRLARRVAELDFLNRIDRTADDQPDLPHFLNWIAAELPAILPHSDLCRVAVELEGATYGNPEAYTHARHIVEGLRVEGARIGQLVIAYTDPTQTFENEDSALVGAVGARITAYVESRRLLRQVQRRASLLQKATEVGAAITARLAPEQLLAAFATHTQQAFNLAHVLVYLHDDAHAKLTRHAAASAPSAPSAYPLPSTAPSAYPLSSAASAAESGSRLILPLTFGAELIGVLDLQQAPPEQFDSQDQATFVSLAAQLAAAFRGAQQFRQTEQALQELQTLQSTLTHDGWEAFLTAKTRALQGYLAQGNTLKPIAATPTADAETAVSPTTLAQRPAATVPIRLGGVGIARLGVYLPDGAPLPAEEQQLLDALSDQIAQALERTRLAEQTQQALAETATLYAIGTQLNAARSLDDILHAVTMPLALHRNQTVAGTLFTVGSGAAGAVPDQLVAVATTNERLRPILWQPLPFEVFPAGNLIMANPDAPILVPDVATDTRIDDNARQLLTVAGTRTLAVLPLRLADRWLGVCILGWPDDTALFDDDDARLFRSIAAQMAVVLNSQILFSQVQKRARQEQLLREITTRVNSAVDADSILRTAAQEVGRALGLETFVYLTDRQLAAAADGRQTNGHPAANTDLPAFDAALFEETD
ncbi:MAG: GAF domain-containing protein [Anaerolineales bacterium]|nr:GAF domain-containing protein [Anaerolineales bacterium]